MGASHSRSSSTDIAIGVLFRVALFSAGWWVLAAGYPSSWLFGVPFVALATSASLALSRGRTIRISPTGFLMFAVFFLWNSVMSGVTVASLALKPSMPIAPGFIAYPFRLHHETARVLMADSATLLPGTLSAGIEGETLILHAIDCEPKAIQELRALEERIARMFALDLDETVGGATFFE